MNVVLSAKQDKPNESWPPGSPNLELSHQLSPGTSLSKLWGEKSHVVVFCFFSISFRVFPLFLTCGSDGTDTVLAHLKP